MLFNLTSIDNFVLSLISGWLFMKLLKETLIDCKSIK